VIAKIEPSGIFSAHRADDKRAGADFEAKASRHHNALAGLYRTATRDAFRGVLPRIFMPNVSGARAVTAGKFSAPRIGALRLT
jgi:hypothetical protein